MTRTRLAELAPAELESLRDQLTARLDQLRGAGLNLDLTRGKPGPDQLDLSNGLDGILAGDFGASDGTDTRNYGGLRGAGLRGIPEARALGGEILDLEPEQVIAGGNSSLSLMYLVIETALRDGLWGPDSSWSDEATRSGTPVRMLAPVPGYDRHFTICEQVGIEMVNVPMTDSGPDIQAIELLLTEDPMIKGIWCVPKYSNPTGCIYAERTVEAIAGLPNRAGRNFLVVWDNAYAVHDFEFPRTPLANILGFAQVQGTAAHIAMFASTSKITFAGAGLGFLGGSETLLLVIEERLRAMTVGHDKVNQLRHARFLRGRLETHMQAHANLIRGKFDAVQDHLDQELSGLDIACWTRPRGGYFVSIDTRPGLARRIIGLAAEVGVALTPAGATFPYGRDPEDRNIRIAPTFPDTLEIEAAMEVFTLCVRLAAAEQIIDERRSAP
ncbi:MAG: aminotransferase class I/II-fold pyridoxal phosphate-dependent enzyme [Gammaproteobacteria bacterium]|nr:MAG: aminotransferase class I/II-fold pyridoxal phosphate-dependent enzyme [Gammaproteobacteria bacterium]TDJ37507.1 MAG: aminotransferase class I/II-fold pyridoxal phosphate-dependent enzyme [Gammaproteobacteria bacterium]